jgi:hypothetical protein
VLIRYESSAWRAPDDRRDAARAVHGVPERSAAIKFDADALDVAIQRSAAGARQGIWPTDPVTLAVDLRPRFAAFRASTVPTDASATPTVVVAAQTTPIRRCRRRRRRRRRRRI